MVDNFREGGAAINVFCSQHRIELHIVDAGVDHDFEDKSGLIDAKINRGTRNFLYGSAMTEDEFQKALNKGAEIVNLHAQGSNIIGFGEMGIGNTSASSILMSLICKLPLEACVGKGTGLNSAQLMHKFLVLHQALENYKSNTPDWMNLSLAIPYFAGYEMVMMAGAMLQTASLGKIIMVDGFIATTVFACAYVMNPLIREYAIFTHLSEEQGHAKLIEYLQSEPLLNLKLRLGEGSGCALAYPILESACLFLREMASFDQAKVNRQV
jgi:nicotinate-nucleotide--dimethylbenzimidazole phosphoribosyltransferase